MRDRCFGRLTFIVEDSSKTAAPPAIALARRLRVDLGSQYPQAVEPAAARAVIASANMALSEEIGAPVAIQPEIFRSEDDWPFV